MTTKGKIIAGYFLMVLLLAIATTIGYVSLNSTMVGIKEAARLSTFSTSSSNLVAYLNRSGALLNSFLESADPTRAIAARAELQKALKEVANCESVVVRAGRRDSLEKIRQYILEGEKLEEKIQIGIKEAADQYSSGMQVAVNVLIAKMHSINDAAKHVNNPSTPAALFIAAINLGATRSNLALFGTRRLAEDGARAEESLRLLETSLHDIEQHMQAEETKRVHAESIRALEEIKISFGTMQVRLKAVQGDLGKVRQLLVDLMGLTASLSEEVDVESAKIAAALEESTRTAERLTLTVGGIGLLLGIACAIFLIRGLVNVLDELSRFAVAVAKGDFHASIKVREGGEIGSVVNALQTIPTVLKQMLDAYATLESDIQHGHLDQQADPSRFSGEFASLIRGTNNVLSCFRLVIDSIPTPIITMTPEMRVIFMNKIGQSLAGEGYKNQNAQELFKAEDRGTSSDGLQKAIATQSPVSGETKVCPRGTVMDVTYSSIPMHDGQGKFVCILQLVSDITKIKQTQRTIVDVATQAMDISNRVATAAEELSAQVEGVTRGTDIQRDRAASTATAMEEMNATVLEVARSAGQASEQAEATREKAAHGAAMVNKVITAIHQVNRVAIELQSNMKELGTQAESIGGVMNVISDIADQTNLLALNAAIEAARAGEAGRGFAVVADEVRKLAEKTMGATTEVGASIRGIQASASNNITRVGEAAKSVTEATDLAGVSGEALQEILQLVGNNSSIIASIATAAEEQSATSDEISHSVGEVNRIAGETASGMVESSAAVEELSNMAQKLKGLLDKLQHQ